VEDDASGASNFGIPESSDIDDFLLEYIDIPLDDLVIPESPKQISVNHENSEIPTKNSEIPKTSEFPGTLLERRIAEVTGTTERDTVYDTKPGPTGEVSEIPAERDTERASNEDNGGPSTKEEKGGEKGQQAEAKEEGGRKGREEVEKRKEDEREGKQAENSETPKPPQPTEPTKNSEIPELREEISDDSAYQEKEKETREFILQLFPSRKTFDHTASGNQVFSFWKKIDDREREHLNLAEQPVLVKRGASVKLRRREEGGKKEDAAVKGGGESGGEGGKEKEKGKEREKASLRVSVPSTSTTSFSATAPTLSPSPVPSLSSSSTSTSSIFAPTSPSSSSTPNPKEDQRPREDPTGPKEDPGAWEDPEPTGAIEINGHVVSEKKISFPVSSPGHFRAFPSQKAAATSGVVPFSGIDPPPFLLLHLYPPRPLYLHPPSSLPSLLFPPLPSSSLLLPPRLHSPAGWTIGESKQLDPHDLDGLNLEDLTDTRGIGCTCGFGAPIFSELDVPAKEKEELHNETFLEFRCWILGTFVFLLPSPNPLFFPLSLWSLFLIAFYSLRATNCNQLRSNKISGTFFVICET
jgi:hypothetical protein